MNSVGGLPPTEQIPLLCRKKEYGMSRLALTASESHELATRVSALGAKQVLLLLRQLQNQSLALSLESKESPHEQTLRQQTETSAKNKASITVFNNYVRPNH